MSNISAWSATAASNNATPPDGAPEGMSASGVNDCIRENMAAVRRWYVDAEWVDRGETPTRVDDDTFTVATDLTAIYHTGRRLKVGGSATGYCTIASSSYSAPNTTVNVTMDSGNLPATLSTVYVAAMSYSNSSLPLVPDGRLSSNVPLKNAANVFSLAQSIAVAGAASLSVTNSSASIGTYFGADGSQGFIGTSTNHAFLFYSNNTDRGAISAAGNWTLNAPSSGNTLALTQGAADRALTFTDGTVQGVLQTVGGNSVAIGAISAHPVGIYASTGTKIATFENGQIIGAPTGGDKGAGTLNTAGAIYQNGVAIVDQGSFSASLNGTSFTMTYTRVGNLVTMYVGSEITETAVGSPEMEVSGIPAALRPASVCFTNTFYIKSNGAANNHTLVYGQVYSDGTMEFVFSPDGTTFGVTAQSWTLHSTEPSGLFGGTCFSYLLA